MSSHRISTQLWTGLRNRPLWSQRPSLILPACVASRAGRTSARRLGEPKSILCLGNGPSSEDAGVERAGFDCLFRVNWIWQRRTRHSNPDVVFTADLDPPPHDAPASSASRRGPTPTKSWQATCGGASARVRSILSFPSCRHPCGPGPIGQQWSLIDRRRRVDAGRRDPPAAEEADDRRHRSLPPSAREISGRNRRNR